MIENILLGIYVNWMSGKIGIGKNEEIKGFINNSLINKIKNIKDIVGLKITDKEKKEFYITELYSALKTENIIITC